MKQFNAPLLESETIAPGLVRAVLATSEMPASRPGQFFLVRPETEALDPYLRQSWFAPRVVGERAEFWPGSEARATTYDLYGPFGHGLRSPGDAAHVLIVAEHARAAAILLGFIEQCVGEGREVALICGEPRLPEFLLPVQVEYQTGGPREGTAVSVLQGAGAEAVAWAEALIGAGSREFCGALANAARGRLRPAVSRAKARGQVLLVDSAIIMPCGTGACYLCAVETRRGLQLACREGPAFELDDWVT